MGWYENDKPWDEDMRWRIWGTMACVLAFLMLATAASAHAGPYEDALAARERGDHVPMYRLMRKYAEQGFAEAQYKVGFFTLKARA